MTETKKESEEEQKQHKQIEKKSYNWVLIIIGAVFVIIVLSVIFTGRMTTFSSSPNMPPPVNSEPKCKDVQIPYESQEEYMKTEYYTESVPYTDTECENKNIAYSIDNFRIVANNCNKEQDVCNKYFLGICSDKTTFCVDRTISCSLELRNLDSEERGVFTVRFNFYEVGTSNAVKNEDASNLVYAQTTNTLTGVARITSEGIKGDANKQLSCSYAVPNIPTKQVCKDVIKYKDVQRERQVTAYKPVTKYRTEQKCD
jgi:hypothetical protein